jgi:hypothetical protein
MEMPIERLTSEWISDHVRRVQRRRLYSRHGGE